MSPAHIVESLHSNVRHTFLSSQDVLRPQKGSDVKKTITAFRLNKTHRQSRYALCVTNSGLNLIPVGESPRLRVGSTAGLAAFGPAVGCAVGVVYIFPGLIPCTVGIAAFPAGFKPDD